MNPGFDRFATFGYLAGIFAISSIGSSSWMRCLGLICFSSVCHLVSLPVHHEFSSQDLLSSLTNEFTNLYLVFGELILQSYYQITDSIIIRNGGYLGAIAASLALIVINLEEYDRYSLFKIEKIRTKINYIPLHGFVVALWFIFMNISIGNLITAAVYATQLFFWVLQLKNSGIVQDQPQKSTEIYFGIFKLPLIDGVHRIQNVVLYSFSIGAFSGIGLQVCSIGPWRPFGMFMVLLSFFHTAEYCVTTHYHDDAGLSSFLLDHSREYHLAMAVAIAEYLVGIFIMPAFKSNPYCFWIGFGISLGSQSLRSIAMITAATNFNHIVQTEKIDGHELVTVGVYKYLRHPSYTGFFYWSVGLQIMLANPISFMLYFYALVMFYSYRIPYEEAKLLEFFGTKYEEYQRSTFVFIPMRKFKENQD